MRSGVARIEIDAAALRHNALALREAIPNGASLVAVVKGNAYGHGMAEVVPVLEPLVDAFQVDDLGELVALRGVSAARAFVFGFVPPGDLIEAMRLNAELVLFDVSQVRDFVRAAGIVGQPVRVHLEIDALLGRLGVLPAAVGPLAKEIAGHPEIEPVAAFAHFANIEDTTDPGHAKSQAALFDEAHAILTTQFPALKRHLSATSGLLAHESGVTPNDFVRCGIGLYGLYPSSHLARTHMRLSLIPVMRWVARLAQVKELPAGHPVGYGLSHVCNRPTRIGIVPQGYADGVDRRLSNCGEVLVGGVRRRMLGRVAMNMFAVDLSGAPDLASGDEVVLLGDQGADSITADDIAERIGTIHYEVVARVSPLLKRVVVAGA